MRRTFLVFITFILASAANAQKRDRPVKGASDFVTASEAGFITAAGDTAVLDLHAGIKQGRLVGDMAYFDPKVGRVASTAITTYQVVDGFTRVVQGAALVDAQRSIAFTVTVSDRGEPGFNDTVVIVFNGYQAAGTLVEGNIQIHAAKERREPCK